MESSQAQADPNPAPSVPDLAHAPVPAVATPDAGSSSTTQLNQPAPDPAQAVDVAGMDEDAYIAARDALLALPPNELPGEPATPPATPTETPADGLPANENPEPPADPDAPANEDDVAIPNRIRLGELPENDRALTAAAVLLAKAQKIPIAEAMARIAPPATPAAPTDATPAADLAANDPDAIAARIEQLEADFDAAGQSADTVAMVQATKELRAAERDLAAATTARATAIQDSIGKARALYPALKDPESPLSKHWDAVMSRLTATQDPLAAGRNPNTPLIVTQMAAAELGIAPADPKAKPVAAPAKASPSVPATTPSPNAVVRPVQPAPGSSRTAVPSNPTGQHETQIAGIKSLDDYEQVRDALLAAR